MTITSKQRQILVKYYETHGQEAVAAKAGMSVRTASRRVLYTTGAGVVQDLMVAKRDLRLNPQIKHLDKFEALLIGDISYIPQTRDETDVLFVLLAQR